MGLLSSKYYYNHTTEVYKSPERIDVHEHRAPTDESVRLLNEMQEKAINNIIAKINIEQNFLKAEGIVIRQELVSFCPVCYIKFILNGKEHRVSLELKLNANDSFDIMIYKEQIVKAIYEKFAEVIAKELIAQTDSMKNIINNITF